MHIRCKWELIASPRHTMMPASRSALRSVYVDWSNKLNAPGLDVFGVGEHHRREFLDSAPVVILGAAAMRTQRIRLTSAVTVLSAADHLIIETC